jgi:hypothetical protein
VETHPDNVADIRIDSPFPELSNYAKSFDFNTQDTLEFGHIPYVAILLKYMDEWKQEVSFPSLPCFAVFFFFLTMQLFSNLSFVIRY